MSQAGQTNGNFDPNLYRVWIALHAYNGGLADFAPIDPAYSEAALEALSANDTNKQNYANALRSLRSELFTIGHLLSDPSEWDKIIKHVAIENYKALTTHFFPDKEPSQLESEAKDFLASLKTVIIRPDENGKPLNSRADTKSDCGDSKGGDVKERALVVYQSPINSHQRTQGYFSGSKQAENPSSPTPPACIIC